MSNKELLLLASYALITIDIPKNNLDKYSQKSYKKMSLSIIKKPLPTTNDKKKVWPSSGLVSYH